MELKKKEKVLSDYQKVISLMKEGWILYTYTTGLQAFFLLQEKEIFGISKIIQIHKSTFRAMWRKGLVRFHRKKLPAAIYILTIKGQVATHEAAKRRV